jgi:hypothetical protein
MSILLIVAMLVASVGGLGVGRILAQRGLTAENALKRHQRQVYRIGLPMLGVGTCLGIMLTAGRHSPWLPSWLLLYTGAYFWAVVLVLCSFCTSILVAVELPGWRDRFRLRQLLLFVLISGLGMTLLVYKNLPVSHLARSPRQVDGVVLQTTSYSCSAATIATLTRHLRHAVQPTERQVMELAGTTRQGTTTLGELRALRELGLEPDYQRGLTLDDLVERREVAVLHVIEPVPGARIQHAIALLAIDTERQLILVGNPLYGQQVKTFEEMMDSYWIGAAVFLQNTALMVIP